MPSNQSPKAILTGILKMLVGIPPDRTDWDPPDTSWTESGKPAQAEVLSAERLHRWLSDPPSHFRWILRIRVHPADAPEYEAEVEDWFRIRQPPAMGSTLHVVYDPASPDRVIVDHRSDADREAGVGTPGPANDDHVILNAKWAETASQAELMRGVIRGFRRKYQDLRGSANER